MGVGRGEIWVGRGVMNGGGLRFGLLGGLCCRVEGGVRAGVVVGGERWGIF